MQTRTAASRIKILCAVLSLTSALVSCAGDSNRDTADKGPAAIQPAAPTQQQERLVPALPERFRNNAYEVYQLIEAKITANPTSRAITARIIVQSSAGSELVEMTGEIRDDGSATLVDVAPLSANQHRLTGEAICLDPSMCAKIILNVYYRVGGRTLRKQFVTSALAGASRANDRRQGPTASTENAGRSGQHNQIKPQHSNSQPSPTQTGSPEAVTPQQASAEASQNQESNEDLDHGDSDPFDPIDELVGREQMGEYVGPARNESMIELLFDRPIERSESQKPEPSTADNLANPTQPTGPQQNQSDPVLAQELELGPLLELRTGGRAVGSHTEGRIERASQLAPEGKGFRVIYPNRDTLWGAGITISLIERVSAHLVNSFYPNLTVLVGDISKRKGGDLGSHASHQNGLDVDIAFLGSDKFRSVLDSQGRISSDFDIEKNWQFFRLVADQKVVQDGKSITVLNRIFVHPKIKRAMCEWAASAKILDNPLDAEVMRRIRPTEGHHKHFHLRLRCSPHYPACRNQVDPPPGTGC